MQQACQVIRGLSMLHLVTHLVASFLTHLIYLCLLPWHDALDFLVRNVFQAFQARECFECMFYKLLEITKRKRGKNLNDEIEKPINGRATLTCCVLFSFSWCQIWFYRNQIQHSKRRTNNTTKKIVQYFEE